MVDKLKLNIYLLYEKTRSFLLPFKEKNIFGKEKIGSLSDDRITVEQKKQITASS